MMLDRFELAPLGLGDHRLVPGHDPGTSVILPEGVKRLMRVPDEMLRCVVFLYYKVQGKMMAAGTAGWFAYSLPGFEDRHTGPGLLMTAQHVIDEISKAGTDDERVHIRVNTKDGGTKFVGSDLRLWYQPDRGVDVSILTAASDLLVTDESLVFGGWYLGQNVARAETISAEGIGIGDEVFMVGLFHRHTGRDQNEPIIRVGNIASLPSAPVPTGRGREVDAILIEARSIGGLSGSPVFVHMGYTRWREGEVRQSGTSTPFFFLGIVHGHWEVQADELDAATAADEPEKINTGIAIVVPAETIMSRVLDPIMAEVAKMRAEMTADEEGPTPHGVTQDSVERTADLMGKLPKVSKDEADEVHKGHDQP